MAKPGLLAHFLVIALGFYLTYVLTPPLVRFCRRRGLLDQPGPRKVHTEATPRLGGVVLLIAFVIAVFVGFLWNSNLWEVFRQRLVGVILGGLLVFAVGLYDDLKNVRPTTKLAWQILAAALVILFGYRIHFLNLPSYGVVQLGLLSYPLTAIWLVGVSNTINLIDGLDGLATGVSAIVALTFFAAGLVLRLQLTTLFAAGVLGICLAFLRYNYPPAKIFMGDSGSLFLGYMFAVMSILWPKSLATIALMVPMLALGVPIIETLTTFFRRTLRKQRFYVADNRHIHHFLLDLGLSRRLTLWLFYLTSTLFSLLVMALITQNRKLLFLLVLVLMAFVLILLLHRWNSATNSKRA
jgi:UDP-GlcNAc:undecaprenyl-phosphate GlcNAc-1-phosphate transferase